MKVVFDSVGGGCLKQRHPLLSTWSGFPYYNLKNPRERLLDYLSPREVLDSQGLQEKFCKAEQNCFRTPAKGWDLQRLDLKDSKYVIMKWWPSWLQCKCEWWSTTRIQKSKWILHSYFSK